MRHDDELLVECVELVHHLHTRIQLRSTPHTALSHRIQPGDDIEIGLSTWVPAMCMPHDQWVLVQGRAGQGRAGRLSEASYGCAGHLYPILSFFLRRASSEKWDSISLYVSPSYSPAKISSAPAPPQAHTSQARVHQATPRFLYTLGSICVHPFSAGSIHQGHK